MKKKIKGMIPSTNIIPIQLAKEYGINPCEIKKMPVEMVISMYCMLIERIYSEYRHQQQLAE